MTECIFCGKSRGGDYFCKNCAAPLEETHEETFGKRRELKKRILNEYGEAVKEMTMISSQAASETFADYEKKSSEKAEKEAARTIKKYGSSYRGRRRGRRKQSVSFGQGLATIMALMLFLLYLGPAISFVELEISYSTESELVVEINIRAFHMENASAYCGPIMVLNGSIFVESVYTDVFGEASLKSSSLWDIGDVVTLIAGNYPSLEYACFERISEPNWVIVYYVEGVVTG